MQEPERPPSERSVEYQILDVLKSIANRTPDSVPTTNWWDRIALNTNAVIDPTNYEANGWLPMQTLEWVIPSRRINDTVMLRFQVMADRIEISMRFQSGALLWSRAIFFS